MQCNVGPDERIMRLALALSSRTVAKFMPRGLGIRGLLNVVALAELATAATAYCPLNQLLGINTCEPEEMRGPAAGHESRRERSMPVPHPIGM